MLPDRSTRCTCGHQLRWHLTNTGRRCRRGCACGGWQEAKGSAAGRAGAEDGSPPPSVAPQVVRCIRCGFPADAMVHRVGPGYVKTHPFTPRGGGAVIASSG